PFASIDNGDTTKLTAKEVESYPNFIEQNWQFYDGDNDSVMFPGFSEARLRPTNTELYPDGKNAVQFHGIGWLRLNLNIDSTIAKRPLAMAITHYGASEIYLDGKLIQKFGIISTPDSTVYEDPQSIPFIFTFDSIGDHVLAIRYANYEAENNRKYFKQDLVGFRFMIGETFGHIHMKHQRTQIFTFILLLLTGIFLALSLIHFFMFMYYKKVRSNAYFSLFMFILGGIFLLVYLGYISETPSLAIVSLSLLNPFLVLACIALSGFANSITKGNKWWLRIFLLIGIAILIIRYYTEEAYLFITAFLILAVSIHALVFIIIAMYRRMPGTRIIGGGLLLFTLFILTSFVITLSAGDDFDLNDSTVGGQIYILFLCVAILSIPFSMSVYLAWNFASINKNLSHQLVQVQVLSQKTIEQEQEKQRMLESRKEELEKEVWERTTELRAEKQKSDDLLKNILPDEVAEELKSKGGADAKLIDHVTVLFSDFKGFTTMAENMTPKELVQDIHECFSAFDIIMEKCGLEKIKTIGDAYMAAGGIPSANTTHALDATRAALEMCAFIEAHKKDRLAAGLPYFEIRIGLNTGPVVAGIVGIKKFAYDIWGDTVNTASRMESSGEIGKVNISETTWLHIKDHFHCTPRGKIAAKGKGEIEMFFVDGMKN
ncbi:MAG: adenylate/guanylate cyclase domain-containing protein, partial [Flavobacteriales bacterium]